MALNDQELLHAYQRLHTTFPDDLHIARPLVHMLLKQGNAQTAAELSLGMARRLLAIGDGGGATGFIELCRQLDVDAKELRELASLAKLAGEGEVLQGERRIFDLIDPLSDQEALEFLRQGHMWTVDRGCDIVHQGEESNSFYLILTGKMRVHVQSDGGSITVGSLKTGDYFGEFACIYHLPRSATVTAAAASELLEFSALAVRQLLQRFPLAGEQLMHTVKMRLLQTMARSHPALAELAAADREWLAAEAELLQFEDGQQIGRQAQLEEGCYVLLYGEASACKPLGGKRVCMPFSGGDMFADAQPALALPPNCVVTAKGRCLVCRMPQRMLQAFMNAYGGFEQWVTQYGAARTRRWRQLLEAVR